MCELGVLRECSVSPVSGVVRERYGVPSINLYLRMNLCLQQLREEPLPLKQRGPRLADIVNIINKLNNIHHLVVPDRLQY